MHGRRSASDAKARTRLHSKLQGDQVKAPATLHRVFPHRSHCPIAHGDPVSYMSKIRYENGYKWRRKDKERGREREVGKGEQKGKKREEKRSRKIQETEGVQAGKRGIAIGSVPIPPERYADLKFNAMKGLPPLLFFQPPAVLSSFVF